MTLAAHANAALRSGTALRLPAHPAFMVVRRVRLRAGDTTGDVAAWFDAVRTDGGPLRLSSTGVDGDALVAGRMQGWRIAADGGGVLIEPASVRHDGVSPASVRDAAASPESVHQGAAPAPTGDTPASAVTSPPDAATAALAVAAASALKIAAGRAPALWSEAVERALAILDSPGTGEELSDVAWPHFLLPSSFDLPARRLSAAAATLWLWEGAGAWAGPDADRAHAPLVHPVGNALAVAVAG